MVFSVLDFLMMTIGNELFEEDTDFYCVDDSMVIASNNNGAGFLLIYCILLISYSLMLWVIFYKLPSSYGLIAVRTE